MAKRFESARNYSAWGGSIFTALASIAVIVGWAFNIPILKSGLPSLITMKANTAFGFLFISASVMLFESRGRSRFFLRSLAGFLAVTVFLVAGMTLLEYLLGVNFGIDELIFLDPEGILGKFPPGRLAPITAASFMFLSSGLLILENARRSKAGDRFSKMGQAYVLTALLFSFMALTGYVLGVNYTFGAAFYTQMAIHTSILFILICLTILFLHRDEGLVQVVMADTAGGRMARRLICAAAFGFPIVQLLQLEGQRIGLYDRDFGVFIRVVVNALFFITIVWISAVELHETDLERERNKKKTEDQEKQMRLVTDALPALVAYVEPDFHYKFVNRSYEKWFGRPRSDILGRHMGEVIGQSLFSARNEYFTAVLRGETVHFSGVMQDREGAERNVETDYVPDFGTSSQVKGFVVLVHDVTAIKRKEIERTQLAASEQAAREASRLKSEFLAHMSHEIRTPINGIIGMSSLILETSLDSQQRVYADSLHRSADSLLSVINGILDFSKIEAGKVDLEELEFDVYAAVKDIGKMFRFEAEKKSLAFDIEISPDIPTHVRGDPGRLRQILANLVGNAIKFTPAGQVQVVVMPAAANSETVEIRFEVRDTGIGISKASSNRLFKPFSQADVSTNRRFGGTGLGLTISKRLVELMNGVLGVESVEGQGATFWFTAKFLIAASSPKEDASELSEGGTKNTTKQSAARQQYRILVAEDNPTSQLFAVTVLNRRGFSAEGVSNGKEAVLALQENDYDLVLMDCQMPEMDGFCATAEIRKSKAQRNCDIPIVALTANAMKDDREKCLAVGMDDYLSKPIRTDDLMRVIERWLIARPVKVGNKKTA